MNYQLKEIIKNVSYWTIPPGIQDCISLGKKLLKQTIQTSAQEKTILKRNEELYNRHKGERCFVLATGPSIKDENLTFLQNEYCFSVSEFYKHKHYQIINPSYYCSAPLHPPFTEQDFLRRLQELSQYSKNQIHFYSLSDKNTLIKSKLINIVNNIYYLRFTNIEPLPSVIDLTSFLPRPQSVTIMAIYIAIYMGFKNIYLLGCDHNTLWTWNGQSNHHSDHFYNGTPTLGYEEKSGYDVDLALKAHCNLRKQYRWIKEVALSQKINIINLSSRTYIDIFYKSSLNKVLNII
jgi:hypothetical protein